MAKVLISEGETILTAVKRLVKMLSIEGILARVKNVCFYGYMTRSQKRRNKKKVSFRRVKNETAKIRKLCQKMDLVLDPDIKPSNDDGQNNDSSWATGNETWAPDLRKTFLLPPPLERVGHLPERYNGPAHRFGFGEQFRRTAVQTEGVPTTHVCGIAEYEFRGQTGFILVRGLNDDGTERARFAFPGGGVEAGETAEEAVVREYLEETHLQVRVVQKIFSETANSHTFMAYWVKITSGNPQKGDEIVEMRLMTPDFLHDFIKDGGVSLNHIKTFEAFEKLQERRITQEWVTKARQTKQQKVAGNLARLTAENKKDRRKNRGRVTLPSPWVEINKTRRPRPITPADQIKGGNMYKLAAETAELKKLGITVSAKLQIGETRDKWDFLTKTTGLLEQEEDGCILKNGQNDRFALTISFPTDLKGTKLMVALQNGERGVNLQQIYARSAGENRAGVVKLISTYEVNGGYSTKFPENNLLLLLVRKQQLTVYRLGIVTRIYDMGDGGTHHFLVVQKMHQAQLYQNTDGNLVTDDEEYDGFNRWADMQRMVSCMVNKNTLPVFKATKAQKTASKKMAEDQATVIFFDILKGFGMATVNSGEARYFHWLQTDSNDRLPYFEKGQLVKFASTYQSPRGTQLVGVSAVAGR